MNQEPLTNIWLTPPEHLFFCLLIGTHFNEGESFIGKVTESAKNG